MIFRYMLRRVMHVVPALLVVSVISFLLLQLIPGDPVLAILGTDATPDQIANLRVELGLDQPLPVQYWQWMRRLLSGDLGNSIVNKRPVAALLRERLPVTFALATSATLVSVLVALPLGVVAAARRGTWVDRAASGLALIGLSVPNFWMAILLILLLGVRLRLLPFIGYVPLSREPWQWLAHIVMPALAVGLTQAGIVMRTTRSAMLEVLHQEYVRTARAKGLAERVVLHRHALRNALIPVLTIVGIDFGALLGSTVIIETIFSLPGLGSLMVYSILARDYPVVQVLLLFLALMYLLINLIVDISYRLVMPYIDGSG